MKTINWSAISLKSLSLPSLTNIPALANLQRREKIAIAAACAALLLFLILQLIIFPIMNRRTRLSKAIITKTSNLQEIHSLKAEYQSKSRSSVDMERRLKRRQDTFTLFSLIDRLAGKSGIKGNIIYMKPSTANIKNSSLKLSTVEMKLNSLTMEQLTTFLHGVENIRNVVWIKRITLSKGDKNQDLLNVVLQVETFQK